MQAPSPCKPSLSRVGASGRDSLMTEKWHNEVWAPVSVRGGLLPSLTKPLPWRNPRCVRIVPDLFSATVTYEEAAAVFAVMASCQEHQFHVHTNELHRLHNWFLWIEANSARAVECYLNGTEMLASKAAREALGMREPRPPTPELRFLYDIAAPLVNAHMPGGRFHRLRKLEEYHWRSWPLDNVCVTTDSYLG
jgi:hypothetical protein